MEMRGYFQGLYPFVDLLIEGSPRPVKALIDTGFNADLMLPRELGRTEEILVLATEGDTALVGMGLLFDCSLAMEPSRGVLRIAR